MSIKYFIIVELNEVHFANDEIHNNWYDGNRSVHLLLINAQELNSIHADAFMGFPDLWCLEITITYDKLRIEDGAFRGLDRLHTIMLDCELVDDFSIGLFEAISASVFYFYMLTWPNNINLNEMFANQSFHALENVIIKNVQMPQTKFRQLAASNFTFARRLRHLTMVHCGIEAIAEGTFDGVARTLQYIDLSDNWIKFVIFRMFRRVLEPNARAILYIGNEEDSLVCTCRLIELEIANCPFQRNANGYCLKCELPEQFVAASCGIHRAVELAHVGVQLEDQWFVRIVDIRMSYGRNAIVSILTNFTSKFRLLFVPFDAMQRGDCSVRAAATDYKCINIDKFVDELGLEGVTERNSAEFVTITAIPILYKFGARPMHLITVRMERMTDAWMSFYVIVAIGMFSLTSGIIGACAYSYIIYSISDGTGDESMSQEPTSYEYSIPVDVNTIDELKVQYYYTTVKEPDERDEYVCITDTCYVAVH